MFAIAVLSIVFAAAAPISAQSIQVRTETHVRAATLGNAKLGLLIQDVRTGLPLAEINPDEAMIPASNMKLLTTAAALDMLGDSFTFRTELRLDGRNLILRGDGDPGFGDPRLLEALGMNIESLIDRWVKAVVDTGVKQIDALIVDDRAFDRQFVHESWPTNQLHHWYCAPVAAINFNDNCLDIYAQPTRPGDSPVIQIEPSMAAVEIDNQAITGADSLWISRRLGTNQILIRGEIKHARTAPIHITIDDPPIFFALTFKRRLEAAGVRVIKVQRADAEALLPEGQPIAIVQTTLPTVVLRCNRDSQNLFAEALLKRIGHQLTGQSGSWRHGAAAIRQFLAQPQLLGAEADEVIIDDGSGLSRENRVSARALARLLTYMHGRDEIGEIFYNSLARPQETGTLRNRFTDYQLNGQVAAKSGYLNGVVCLSGYLTVNQRTVAFSMLLNNYGKSVPRAKQMMEEIIESVDTVLAEENPVKLGG